MRRGFAYEIQLQARKDQSCIRCGLSDMNVRSPIVDSERASASRRSRRVNGACGITLESGSPNHDVRGRLEIHFKQQS
jgi:hypothetical protein